ncbi:MAG: cation transporter [Thermoleophilaceae bacterium]|nr:cation transporter [Thermoleophilaceae bacterium]
MSNTERTYVVEGMSCRHCELSVTEGVEEVRGVEAVEVDGATKRLIVLGEEVDDAAVRAAVEEAGYRVAA